MTQARRGSDRRPSGGRSGGGGRPIGEEIRHRRCHQRCFFNTPGLTRQKSERKEELDGALTNRGLTGTRFSGVAAANRVRLGKRTGATTASETKELSRTAGGNKTRERSGDAIFSLSNGLCRSMYLFDGVRDLRPPRSHMHRPGPTGSIGKETRQAFRSGGRAKLSYEGIIKPVIFG